MACAGPGQPKGCSKGPLVRSFGDGPQAVYEKECSCDGSDSCSCKGGDGCVCLDCFFEQTIKAHPEVDGRRYALDSWSGITRCPSPLASSCKMDSCSCKGRDLDRARGLSGDGGAAHHRQTADGNEYVRGFFFDYCSGDSVSSTASDRIDELEDIISYSWPYTHILDHHVFGQLDQVPNQLAVAHCQCDPPISASAAPHYAEEMCSRKAKEAGYECGYAADINWTTCHIECEYATGGACLAAGINRSLHWAVCPDCYPLEWASFAAWSCKDVFPEHPQKGGVAYAYCGRATDGGCACFYKCNLTPDEARGTCYPGQHWNHP